MRSLIFTIFCLSLMILSSCGEDDDLVQSDVASGITEQKEAPKEKGSPLTPWPVEPADSGNTVIDAAAIQKNCGNGECNVDENECICAEDCGACADREGTACYYFSCNAAKECVETAEVLCCGDGTCDSGETCTSCGRDCCRTEKTLADFPMFTEVTIIVGKESSARDIVTAANLASAFKQLNIVVKETKLDSEVGDIQNQDIVAVGGPCDNNIIAELLGLENAKHKKSCQIIPEGEGRIQLIPTSEHTHALLITGGRPMDVEDAADRLVTFQEQPLTGMSVTT